jgi:hypothetical protein
LPIDVTTLQHQADEFFRRLEKLGGEILDAGSYWWLTRWLVAGAVATAAYTLAWRQSRGRSREDDLRNRVGLFVSDGTLLSPTDKAG